MSPSGSLLLKEKVEALWRPRFRVSSIAKGLTKDSSVNKLGIESPPIGSGDDLLDKWDPLRFLEALLMKGFPSEGPTPDAYGMIAAWES